MNKIGIVGLGFVGSAVDYGFSKNVEKFKVDPILNTNIKDLKEFNPEFIFICVPTPMDINGDQDSSIIKEVLKEISKIFKDEIVIIKSTVLPNVMSELHLIYKNIVYNPEFLREKSANEDFLNQEHLILGGDSENIEKVSELFNLSSDCNIKKLYRTDLVTACFVKYSINTFLASKVIFFNQLKDIYDKSGALEKWDNFIEIVSSDNRIGDSHMSVPGHDGRLGYGGACFPKDTAALLKLSKLLEREFTILKEVIKINNDIRSDYKNLEEREKEQGVSFNIDLD